MTENRVHRRNRLSVELAGLLCVSAAVSLFLFAFLRLTSLSLAENYLYYRGIQLTEEKRYLLNMWIQNICFLGSAIFFIWLFLFLFAQKVTYIVTIMRGIEQLRLNRMDFVIPLEGNDELTELADQINYLAHSQRELLAKEEKLKEDRENFIRSLSHDIRNPLTAICSYSEYMRGKKDRTEAETNGYIEMVCSRSQQIRGLMELLLAGNARKTEWIEDGRLLMEQMALEWEAGVEERFSCSISLEKCRNFRGNMDIREIQRIFDNLYTNVERYADPGGPVYMEVKTDNGGVWIIQKNTVLSGRNMEETGRGIGLQNIRQIAGHYHGSVETESGSDTFLIRICLGEMEVEQEA